MQNDTVDVIQKTLQKEADAILANESLWGFLRSKGRVHLAGSYVLDLMVYGDLDVYFEPNNPAELPEVFAQMLYDAGLSDQIKSIQFEKDFHKRRVMVPEGTYLQFKFDNGVRLWQIDIWAVEKSHQDKIMNELERIKAKLTPENRKLVLNIKHHLMQPKGKTPSFCGYFVYKAVLDEGLTDLDEIKAYLIKQGVKLFQ